MANFFDNFDDIENSETPQDYEYGVEGGVSNEAYLNDYRNRKPFHYIEEGTDGYYYWQYGATMEIEIEIVDEVAFTTEEVPVFPVEDVLVGGESVLDEDRKVVLGTMAKENAEDYYQKNLIDVVNAAQELLIQNETARAEAKERDLLDMINAERERAIAAEGALTQVVTFLSEYIYTVPAMTEQFEAFRLATETALQDIYAKLTSEGWVPPEEE